MQMLSKRHQLLIFNIFVLFAGILLPAFWNARAQTFAPRRAAGVIAPPPEVVAEERIAPLLDGLLQDGAAIQFKQLIMEPEVANALNVDAIKDNLQISAQTNSLDAAVNSSNLALLKANTSTQLAQIDKLNTLLDNADKARTDVAAKTKNFNDLKASNADNSTQEAATKATAEAQANLDSINGQIASTRGAIKDSLGAAQLTTTTPGKDALGVSPTATTPLTNFSPTAPQNFTATLPASRQIADRMGNLMERAMALLGVQDTSKPPSGMKLHFLQFMPSVIYSDKKVATIAISYIASCTTESQPRIVDLYPRRSAINITSEKYRDRGFSLAAFFGFSAASASAAYNREHLQLSTALAQSSYVSGYGAGQNEFGWQLGRALGEDTVATGQRVLYALIAVPDDCEKVNGLTVGASQISFFNDKGRIVESSPPASTPRRLSLSDTSATPKLTTLSYEPVAVPSNSTTPVPVYIELEFEQGLDPQAVLSVNGHIIKRARDNFARATVPNGSATSQASWTGGLLETSTLDAGTWVPTGAKSLQITLDARNFTGTFPRLVLGATGKSYDLLSDEVFDTKPTVNVGSNAYVCIPPNCMAGLRSLGTVATNVQNGVAVWWPREAGNRIVISLFDDAGSALPKTGIVPSVVASTDNVSAWSVDAIAEAIVGNQEYPLSHCSPHGLQLICDVPKSFQLVPGTVVSIYDSRHLNGHPVTAKLPLAKQEFSVLGTSVLLVGHGTSWNLAYDVFSVPDAYRNYSVELQTADNRLVIGVFGKIDCAQGWQEICQINLTVPVPALIDVVDNMKVVLQGFTPNPISHTIRVINLYRNLAPSLDWVSADRTRFRGHNLVASSITVGVGHPMVRLECADSDDRTDCKVAKLPSVKSEEYLYFIINGRKGEDYRYGVHPPEGPEGAYLTVLPSLSTPKPGPAIPNKVVVAQPPITTKAPKEKDRLLAY